MKRLKLKELLNRAEEILKEEDIKANFKNGILTIEFPKEPEKRIEEKKYIPIGE